MSEEKDEGIERRAYYRKLKSARKMDQPVDPPPNQEEKEKKE